jgi:WD40 repeat protein
MGITQVGLSVDGSLLISASLDKSVRVWDVHSCQTLRVISSDVVVDSLVVLSKPVEMDGVNATESAMATCTLNPLSRHHVKVGRTAV